MALLAEQAGSLGLFALVVLALAGMAFWNKKLRSGATGKSDSQTTEEAQRFWCWAGVMLDQADRADALKAQLKSVWHLWNNSSKKLIYPLHSAACSTLDSWEDRQLLEFRILYRHHLEDLTIGWKDFQSAITAPGFPNDAITYAFLEEMLPPHAEQLRQQVRRQIEAFAPRAKRG